MFETELKLKLNGHSFSSFTQYLLKFEKLFNELDSSKEYSSSINSLCLDTLRIESQIQNLIQEIKIVESKNIPIYSQLKRFIESMDRETIIRSITPISFFVIQLMFFIYYRLNHLNMFFLIFNVIYSASLIHFYLQNDKSGYDPDPIELIMDWTTNIFFSRINSIAESLDPFLKKSMKNVVWWKPHSYLEALIYILTILFISYYSITYFINFINSLVNFFMNGQLNNNRELQREPNIHNTYNIHLNHHSVSNPKRIADFNNNEEDDVYLSASENETVD